MRAMIDSLLRPAFALAGIAVAMLVAPVAAQGPELAMLDGLRHGSWDIKLRGEGSASSKVCLRNGRELIQLRHRQASCNRVIVDDAPGVITVHYSCPGNGYGQTTIRRESATIVQISSQGVAGNAPFNFNAEGRYAGGC